MRWAVPWLILLAACLDNAGPTTLMAFDTTSAAPVTSAPVPVDTTSPGSACLQGESTFTRSGEIPVELPEGEPDAARVTDARVESEEGCDRLTISLATEGGAPARVAGLVRASIVEAPGVVRVRLDPNVAATAVLDRLLERPLLHSLYVVRSLLGDSYVDVHLADPAEARVFVDRAPALVTVDLRSGSSLGGSRLVARDVVVLLTRTSELTYPLEVVGYSLGGPVTVVLRSDGQASDPWAPTTTDGGGTWAEFDASITEGPTGDVTLEVTGPSGTVVQIRIEIS